MNKTIKKIIILRYGLIGDSLYSFPVLPAIRNYYPEAKIVMVIDPSLKGLLKACPFVDEFITFERYGKEKSFKNAFHWIYKQRQQHYDLALVLNASFQAALLAFVIGAKQRWGFDSEKRAFLLTKSFVPDPPMPQLLKYRKLLEIGGISPGNYQPEIWIDKNIYPEYLELIGSLNLNLSRPIVTFHVGASQEYKIWPATNFIKVANALGDLGCNLIFIGGPSDSARSLEIISQLNHPAINLAGKLDLAVLAELYRHVDLAINNDSGPMHIAAFMGCPVIGLFGFGYPVCWKPWGQDVTVIYDQNITCIKPEEVIKTAKVKLQNIRPKGTL